MRVQYDTNKVRLFELLSVPFCYAVPLAAAVYVPLSNIREPLRPVFLPAPPSNLISYQFCAVLRGASRFLFVSMLFFKDFEQFSMGNYVILALCDGLTMRVCPKSGR